MAYRTIAGFEQPLPGSYDRGNRERARQDNLIQSAGRRGQLYVRTITEAEGQFDNGGQV